jgi:hypothetical protein
MHGMRSCKEANLLGGTHRDDRERVQRVGARDDKLVAAGVGLAAVVGGKVERRGGRRREDIIEAGEHHELTVAATHKVRLLGGVGAAAAGPFEEAADNDDTSTHTILDQWTPHCTRCQRLEPRIES